MNILLAVFGSSKNWSGKIRPVRIAGLLTSLRADPGRRLSRALRTRLELRRWLLISMAYPWSFNRATVPMKSKQEMADTAVIHARVAAEIDHKWVKSTDYPKHEISQSTFEDALGHGKKITSHLVRTSETPRSCVHTSKSMREELSASSRLKYKITPPIRSPSKASEASRPSEAK